MNKFLFFLLILGVGTHAQEIGARYLIITHDNFYDDIQPLAEWKHKKGMRTKIATLSQIGSTSGAIKTYIQDAYNTWQIPPEYLLLVGASNLLPWGSSSSDNYYMDMTGDIRNEILAGRLTVHNTTEAQTVVNKILLYERTPVLNDSSWFIDACLIVREDYDSYDDSIYWSDAYHARSLMRAAGYDSIDTLSRVAGNSASHVISSVNNGRSFVLFRGQGVNNWWSPFDVNPDLTQNGAMLPIVLSITCSTIGSGSSPALAEKWLLTGTPTVPRGGSGYFATTTVITSGAYLRSAVAKGFFNALFLEGAGSLTVGVLLLLGRGGMNSASVDAALLSARAEAVCGTETVGPGEQLRRDSWKSKGFLRAGLFLLTTGSFLILGYVLTL